jgi:hypothetical protein
MKSLHRILVGCAMAIGCVAPAAGQAQTLLITFSDPSLGVSANWEQSSTPTPLAFISGQFTDVPIFNFHSTGSTPITPAYTDISWFNVAFGGGFLTPDFNYSVFLTPASQQYTGPESAPVFNILQSFTGTEFNTGTAVTFTIALAPAAPGPVPGVGLAGFAALTLAGLYARTRRA